MVKLLNHGFVELLQVMGDDAFIAQTARVSTQSKQKTIEEDRNLIRYLLSHEHTTPFEFGQLVFHIKCPIFIARQIVRHRTASLCEISGRYRKLKPEYYMPKQCRKQSETKRQCSTDEEIEYSDNVKKHLQHVYDIIAESYQYFLDEGLSKEQARAILPVGQFTEFYWRIDLHNLFHFLKLRLDTHSQKEMQQYAIAIYELAMGNFPISFEAFNDYILKLKKD